jgi:hypothetical protein
MFVSYLFYKKDFRVPSHCAHIENKKSSECSGIFIANADHFQAFLLALLQRVQNESRFSQFDTNNSSTYVSSSI